MAGWLFPAFGFEFGNALGTKVVDALIGATIVLFVLGLLKRA